MSGVSLVKVWKISPRILLALSMHLLMCVVNWRWQSNTTPKSDSSDVCESGEHTVVVSIKYCLIPVLEFDDLQIVHFRSLKNICQSIFHTIKLLISLCNCTESSNDVMILNILVSSANSHRELSTNSVCGKGSPSETYHSSTKGRAMSGLPFC